MCALLERSRGGCICLDVLYDLTGDMLLSNLARSGDSLAKYPLVICGNCCGELAEEPIATVEIIAGSQKLSFLGIMDGDNVGLLGWERAPAVVDFSVLWEATKSDGGGGKLCGVGELLNAPAANFGACGSGLVILEASLFRLGVLLVVEQDDEAE